MVNTFVRPSFDGSTFTGVEVNVGGEHFLIAPQDLSDKKMSWDDTMKILEQTNNKTFTYKQICAVMMFRDEINTILKENGGEILDKWYWTCTEYSPNIMFLYTSNNGCLGYLNKYHTYSCRVVITLDAPIDVLSLSETDRLSDIEKKVAGLTEDMNKIKNLFD